MVVYFLVGMVLSAGLCFGAYWFIQQKVLEEVLSLDDGKGYYLVACILIGFVLALGCFYTGQSLGYDQQEESSTMMALAILLDIMVAMLTLIFGLVKFREPEHY